MMLTGFPIASRLLSSRTSVNEPGGFSNVDHWVGLEDRVLALSWPCQMQHRCPPISIDATAHFHLVPHSDSNQIQLPGV